MVDLNRIDLGMANRIASAVRLDDIPAKYKSLPRLGRVTTTIALDDGDSVILLTRDVMKREWLRDCGLADELDAYTTHTSHISGMNELPIYVLRVPRLFKLDLANRRLVKKVLEEFYKVRLDAQMNHYGKRNPKEEELRALREHFTKNENHVLAPLFNFLGNYDARHFAYDLDLRNFMQDANGKLVVSDPIVMAEILDLIHADYKRKYQQKQMNTLGWRA